MEDKFTSTGVKFWRHSLQMESYRGGTGHTIISTHISPTSKCNLSCSYCSVFKRNRHYQIELPVIQDYVLKLKTRGLKAVILTGGGEPLLYPDFNQLVCWFKDEGLRVALITNGTVCDKVEKEIWRAFDWIRVSLTAGKINLPIDKIPDSCVIGCSVVFEDSLQLPVIEKKAKQLKATYVRVLPNCFLQGEELQEQHDKIDEWLKDSDNKLFFHQHKVHRQPKSSVCHQTFFRPYLSEVDGGLVFPCDSVVLNDATGYFHRKYSLCYPEQILDFLDNDLYWGFRPDRDCSGCVFANTVDMLDQWKKGELDRFDEFSEPLIHEEFV